METNESDTSHQVMPSGDQSKNVQDSESAPNTTEKNEMDLISQMEEEAKARAAKQVAAMLRRPELLEKVYRM